MSERHGKLSSETIEQVRSATEVVELVSQYVTLKRAGRSFKGLCPFHTEKTPSFTVSPDRQAWYCFGCQKGGDAYSFLMEHDGVSFVEAVRQLGQRAGITLEVERQSGGAHDALYEAAERAAAFFAHSLWSSDGEGARRYLENRGVSRDIAERFRLGYAPDAWESLRPALEEHDVSEQTLLHLGLVARRNSGGSYDLFRHRVMFPIQSLSGRVIGFGGRALPGSDEGAPKYVNSADSPIYHKQRVLYGLAESRGAIRRAETAIITEGYLDYLALVQAGIENVVAACGTAFGPQQAALLHRYTHRAYILGDSDPAGRRAAVRTAGLLLEHGFLVHLVELPSGHDPDTFVRENGAAAMETRLREAPGYVVYMKGLVDRRAGDLAVKERVIQHVIGDIGRISDPLLQELYTKELCRNFGLTEATVAKALDKRSAPASARPEQAAQEEPQAPVSARLQQARSGLLRLGLTGREWGARVVAEFEPDDFAEGTERRVFEAMVRAGDHGRWRDFVESPEEDSFGTAIEIQGPLPGEPARLFQDFRACILETRQDAAKTELRRQLGEAEAQGDVARMRQLNEALQALAQDRKSLRSPMTRQGDTSGGS